MKKILSMIILCIYIIILSSNYCTIANAVTTEYYGEADLSSEDIEWLKNNSTNGYNSINNTSNNTINNNFHTYSISSLPKSVDNSSGSNGVYFPTIGDQGQLNSCTAWAMGYYQLTYTINKYLKRSCKDSSGNNIPENVISPTFLYNLISYDDDSKGSSVSDSLQVLSQIGAAPISSVPVQTSRYSNHKNWNATDSIMSSAQANRILSFSVLFSNLTGSNISGINDSRLTNMKSLLNNGEVLSGTTYYAGRNVDSIDSASHKGEKIITSESNKTNKLSHRITIVGYDDTIWVDINNNGKKEASEYGAFKIANSYGKYKSYENSGFIWLSYSSLVATSSNYINSLKNVISIKVNPYQTNSKNYIKFDLSTKSRKTSSIIISTYYNNVKYSYTALPFNFSNDSNDYSFDGSTNSSKGSFVIDANNLKDSSGNSLPSNAIGVCTFQIEARDTIQDGMPLEISNVRYEEARFANNINNRIINATCQDTIKIDGQSTYKFIYTSLNGAKIYVDTIRNDLLPKPGCTVKIGASPIGGVGPYSYHFSYIDTNGTEVNLNGLTLNENSVNWSIPNKAGTYKIKVMIRDSYSNIIKTSSIDYTVNY